MYAKVIFITILPLYENNSKLGVKLSTPPTNGIIHNYIAILPIWATLILDPITINLNYFNFGSILKFKI